MDPAEETLQSGQTANLKLKKNTMGKKYILINEADHDGSIASTETTHTINNQTVAEGSIH